MNDEIKFKFSLLDTLYNVDGELLDDVKHNTVLGSCYVTMI